MSSAGFMTRWVAVAAALFALYPHRVVACAACFGKSDSAMAQGMNMGIFSLLAVVGVVLSSVAGFFIFLARKSARTSGLHAAAELREPVSHS
jgi:hypothetical protein